MKKLKQATLCLLLKDDQILLAMKKRGFGIGKWNGVGGKPEAGESIDEAAIRETIEEVGVNPINLKKVGVLDFEFEGDKAEWGMQVTVFLCWEWVGEPKETEEMMPKWFKFDEIPYEKMWADDEYWLPLVLNGKSIKAKFLYSEAEKVVRYKITHSKNLS